MRIYSLHMAATVAIALTTVPGHARAASPTEKIYVYSFDRLEYSKLPAQLIKSRQSDPLLASCGGDAIGKAFPATLVPLAIMGFKALFGVADKAIVARENKRIAAMSHSFAGSAAFDDFPFRQATQACLVIDRVSIEGDTLTPRSTYVIGLHRFGSNALSVELLGARIADSGLLRTGKAKTLNADIAVTMATIEQPRDGIATQRTLGTFTTTVRAIDPVKPGARPEQDQPPLLLPLPLPGAPTNVTIAVTESNADLAATKERLALQRKVRGKLIEFAGDLVEKKLGGD